MRRGAVLAVLAGLVLATVVAAFVGLGDVAEEIAQRGWRGLAVLVVWSPAPLLLLGGAWLLAAPPAGPARLPVFVWGRWVRDAGGELLPFSHLGGFVAGARAVMLFGLSGRQAFSSTVVDVTAELIAQLGFTGLGLSMLVGRFAAGSARDAVAVSAAAGLALTTLAAVAFIVLQRRGGGAVQALARRLLPAAAVASLDDVTLAIPEIYRHPWRVGGAVAMHLAAWVVSGLGVWLALWVAGVRIDPMAVLAIESLVAAARSAVVVAPMGLGVQETAYALVGPALGLHSDVSLALSLIRRARDLLVGAPALLAWQGLEGAKALRSPPAKAPSTPPAQGSSQDRDPG